MDSGRYIWRKASDKQRKELLAWRQKQGHPWHSPPHRPSEHFHYHVTAACYEHRAYIGLSLARMDAFSRELVAVSRDDAQEYVVAWCVLPNHYHLLLATADILGFLGRLGKLHGRTSFMWNGEETAIISGHQGGRRPWKPGGPTRCSIMGKDGMSQGCSLETLERELRTRFGRAGFGVQALACGAG